jgi:hypothetical protein
LPGSVEPIFLERMATAFPDRIQKITNRIKEVRGGALTDNQFFQRHRGEGTYWETIAQLFQAGRRRAGFPEQEAAPIPTTFRRPQSEQGALF